jgi:hypothetical protein
MSYRAYSGPRGSETMSPLDKEHLLYKEFDTLDGALAWARHVNEGGRVTLLIEGDDGTRLDKRDVVTALHHGERAGVGETS